MSISLCMVVKNEEADLADCLGSILPLVDEVLIADTGSTDATPDIIRELAGSEAIRFNLSADNCYSITPARNELYGRVRTDWIFYLDADERYAGPPPALMKPALAEAGLATDGFFGAWRTRLADGEEFEDYKLFIFRSSLRKRGLAHANVQLDLRQKGGTARWLAGLDVLHRPQISRLPEKRVLYWRRLQRAMELEPGWYRHNWFAGYMCFLDGRFAEAKHLFRPLIESRSPLFPVEGLNARMVLADIQARQGDRPALKATVAEALAFAGPFWGDFEVVVNFRLRPWFQNAERTTSDGDWQGIRAYRFAS